MRAAVVVAVLRLRERGSRSRLQVACERKSGAAQFLPAVPEASGDRVCRRRAVDAQRFGRAGAVPASMRSGRATPVTVAGADVRDWEDLASVSRVGYALRRACLYIADIGDNQESRERITIYEVPVPAPGSTSTKPATAIHVRYPDGPHDAEALVVTRKGQASFIITKDVPPRVYTFAASQNPGETGTLTLFRTLNENVRITGAAVSPDERWVALRSNRMLFAVHAR